MRGLDVFSGAGGASMGYHRAGFDMVGVDLDAQPRYPFQFVQDDALAYLKAGYWIRRNFDFIHASPPCQAYSDLQKQNKRGYPELIEPVRELLQWIGLPYVIENVEGAPLVDPIRLCGTMFDAGVPDTQSGGLRVIRHRLFESNVPLVAPEHDRKHPLVHTKDKRKRHYGLCDEDTCFVQVTGGGNSTVAAARDAMGIPWMTKKELNEAIPPAYTEYIGRQVFDYALEEDWS